ncbi:hypothetical protein [Runella sp.]|uniref:hypothetical protein n=1 Tax=Runella sp. TaxID=1960881 RepID=UPI003D0A9C66
MIKKLLSVFPILLITGGFISSVDFPSAKITNGLIEAELYLPDAGKGYYQGTRFDWSGVMPRLDYKGHSYFGIWNPAPYDPKLHDAIAGPVEEFVALGYNEAEVGGEFLKIGVGTMVKLDTKPYSFSQPYQIKNAGKWTVKTSKDKVEFIHEITDAAGYGYVYRKTVKLTKGKPELVLEHSLKNTGQKLIETQMYNHNFFMIDNEPTGPNIKTLFPYEIKAEGKGFGSVVKAENREISYTKEIASGEFVYSGGVQGFDATPEDYDILIQNLKTGASVQITCDKPLEKLVYWACHTTACPEPYIKLSVKPQEEVHWKIKYKFIAH